MGHGFSGIASMARKHLAGRGAQKVAAYDNKREKKAKCYGKNSERICRLRDLSVKDTIGYIIKFDRGPANLAEERAKRELDVEKKKYEAGIKIDFLEKNPSTTDWEIPNFKENEFSKGDFAPMALVNEIGILEEEYKRLSDKYSKNKKSINGANHNGKDAAYSEMRKTIEEIDLCLCKMTYINTKLATYMKSQNLSPTAKHAVSATNKLLNRGEINGALRKKLFGSRGLEWTEYRGIPSRVKLNNLLRDAETLRARLKDKNSNVENKHGVEILTFQKELEDIKEQAAVKIRSIYVDNILLQFSKNHDSKASKDIHNTLNRLLCIYKDCGGDVMDFELVSTRFKWDAKYLKPRSGASVPTGSIV